MLQFIVKQFPNEMSEMTEMTDDEDELSEFVHSL